MVDVDTVKKKKNYVYHHFLLEKYNKTFAAKELGYSYTAVANYLGVKPATVKDWFACRSRNKERMIFKNLAENEKSQLFSRVKTAELNGKPKSISSN